MITYLDFESFIHPDVLSAFLIKKDDIVLTTVGDIVMGSEIITVSDLKDVSEGETFTFANVTYTIRLVNTITKQIFINSLQSDIPNGTQIVIYRQNNKNSLENFYNIGVNDYNVFATSLINSGVQVRFNEDVYVLKRAFIAMYTWVLQNKAFLKNLDLTGVGIKKSEVYDHFFDLLETEKKDLENIRKEANDELARKQQNDADGKSGKGFVRYTRPNRGYFSGYRRW